jgi:hypothetical protein
MRPVFFSIVPALLALYMPTCGPALRETTPPWEAHMAELWQLPTNLAAEDLFYGPWGQNHAPDPLGTYRLIARKHQGTNPGVTVIDGDERVWHVKQAPDNDQGAEGPIEVVLSRILSAVGYHQPPVYFLPSFRMTDTSGTHIEPGGRFRLAERSLKDRGPWSWQQNPFVGTSPYQGLLVVLLMFNSSDLKNDNNTLYEVKNALGDSSTWYVVRDLGTALGETGRLAPTRGDADLFVRSPFISGFDGPFVKFAYHGWHQELVRDRITRHDVWWAADLLAGLSEQQWQDAFRAGGYERSLAQRFIARIQRRIADGRRLDAE